ncbi:MAG: hypothetical protein WA188_18255 [Terriglobales bacterium]
MAPLDQSPELSPFGVIIGQSELLRALLLVLIVRGIIDKATLDNLINEVIGGIRERGYDSRFTPDAERYVRDILAQVKQQFEVIERLDRESGRPQ